MRKCEICGYHLDMHSDLCERMKKEIARAEKAEARVKEPEAPDLGEIDGVKLPAWLWDKRDKRLRFAFLREGKIVLALSEGLNCWWYEAIDLIKYTGQDKVKPIDIEALKKAARLV
jgi:hypothetical protein